MDLVSIFFGGLLRASQSAVEAMPTLLCGLLIAGVFSHVLGPTKTARLFGEGTRQGLFRAWVMGMLLPVCSLGVFPIIREMRRAGISGGTILAFSLSGPLFNPLSFLYGLTLSEPMVIISFAFASLLVVTLAGLVWDQLFPHSKTTSPEEPAAIPYGMKRFLGAIIGAARLSAHPVMGYCIIALFGVALLGAFIPFGSLERTMRHDDPASPLLMAAIATPAYISPMRAMMQMGLLFEHGNSVGAGLTLLILGAGCNLGVIAWTLVSFGWKRMLVWMGLLVATVLLISYVLNAPLDFATQRENHTHAFDEFTNPYHGPVTTAKAYQSMHDKLAEKVELHELASLYALGILMLIGSGLKQLDRVWVIETWLRRRNSLDVHHDDGPWWNRPLPTSWLTVILLLALVGFSVFGCFLYYPEESVLLDQMKVYRTEVQSALITYGSQRSLDHLQRMIPKLDDLSRKLEVSLFLRRWRLDPVIHSVAEEYRETLEEVRDASREGKLQLADVPSWNAKVFKLHQQLRDVVTDSN